jgi:Spy/CpxP family protein refolding chaperone
MRFLSPGIPILLLAAALSFALPAIAQNEPPPDGQPKQRRLAGEERPNLLTELGLSQEQVQEIRRMNQARRPLIEEAARKLREANRALDVAIYADHLNEDDIAARLKDFQLAQGEMQKLRFQGELELRKVLTPDQLNKFRRLREQFGRRREMRQNRRRGVPPSQRPLNRIRQLPKRGNQN